MKLSAFLLPVLLAATTAFGASPDDILGPWKTVGDRSEVELFRCGDKICGKVAWLMNANYMNSKDGPVGTPKVDRKNPDPTLRTRPIIGLQVIEGLAPAGDNRWDHGLCYDPESGNTYKCKARLASPERLEVRGFIGISLFGRTYVLTRKGTPAGPSPHASPAPAASLPGSHIIRLPHESEKW
ncbi:MAG TPA: DUF2147 domain-containing protein [Geobacteraceae bacterium]